MHDKARPDGDCRLCPHLPLKNSIFAESEGYEPADFDKHIEGQRGGDRRKYAASSNAAFHPVPAAGVR
jgi:hypothetical protein